MQQHNSIVTFDDYGMIELQDEVLLAGVSGGASLEAQYIEINRRCPGGGSGNYPVTINGICPNAIEIDTGRG